VEPAVRKEPEVVASDLVKDPTAADRLPPLETDLFRAFLSITVPPDDIAAVQDRRPAPRITHSPMRYVATGCGPCLAGRSLFDQVAVGNEIRRFPSPLHPPEADGLFTGADQARARRKACRLRLL